MSQIVYLEHNPLQFRSIDPIGFWCFSFADINSYVKQLLSLWAISKSHLKNGWIVIQWIPFSEYCPTASTLDSRASRRSDSERRQTAHNFCREKSLFAQRAAQSNKLICDLMFRSKQNVVAKQSPPSSCQFVTNLSFKIIKMIFKQTAFDVLDTQCVCPCGWATYRSVTQSSRALKWLSKQIERESRVCSNLALFWQFARRCVLDPKCLDTKLWIANENRSLWNRSDFK